MKKGCKEILANTQYGIFVPREGLIFEPSFEKGLSYWAIILIIAVAGIFFFSAPMYLKVVVLLALLIFL